MQALTQELRSVPTQRKSKSKDWRDGQGGGSAVNEETDTSTGGWSRRWMARPGRQMCGCLGRSDQIVGGLVGGRMVEQMIGERK